MTVTLSPADLTALVTEAARAPSVHNIQPARWRFTPDGSVILFRAVDRALPIADPTGRDLLASLGAAFEGMSIALSTRGAALSAPQSEHGASAPGCAPVVRASIESSTSPADPLAPYVMRRRSFRGRFRATTSADVEVLSTLIAPDLRLIAGTDALNSLAATHDAATWTFESRAEYHAELWSWLRLSRSDPRYHRDGLNADCLALSAVERWAAQRLLAPKRFSLLTRVGVARHLVSEGGQVRSASAAIVYCPRLDATPFDVGRRMYRLWLELTAAGFHLCPMSASADDPHARRVVEAQARIPSDRRVANVFRVGRILPNAAAESPRLPAGELMV